MDSSAPWKRAEPLPTGPALAPPKCIRLSSPPPSDLPASFLFHTPRPSQHIHEVDPPADPLPPSHTPLSHSPQSHTSECTPPPAQICSSHTSALYTKAATAALPKPHSLLLASDSNSPRPPPRAAPSLPPTYLGADGESVKRGEPPPAFQHSLLLETARLPLVKAQAAVTAASRRQSHHLPLTSPVLGLSSTSSCSVLLGVLLLLLKKSFLAVKISP